MEKQALHILNTLRDGYGHLTYYAGGWVRDKLIGRPAKDIDIVTAATPDQVIDIFGDKLVHPDIGKSKQFGIVTVVIDGINFEVATFRVESDYKDGRRPSVIEFPVSAAQDARRRDFTMNGIFYCPKDDQYIDYVGGIEAIKQRRIEFIGEARDRILDDHLRIMRGIRFEATLPGFELDEKALYEMKRYSHLLTNIAIERVKDELFKGIQGHAPQFMAQMRALNMLPFVLPEIIPVIDSPQNPAYHPEGDVWTHTMLVLQFLKDEHIHVKLGGLFHDIGKPAARARDLSCNRHDKIGADIAKQALLRLRCSNDEIEHITYLVANHMRVNDALRMKPAKFLKFAAEPYFNDVLRVLKADNYGSLHFDDWKINAVKARIQELTESEKEVDQVVLPSTLLNGKEIMEICEIEPSSLVGEIKDKLLEAQLINQVTTHDEAINFVKSVLKRTKG